MLGPRDMAVVGAGDLDDRLKLIAYAIHKGYADPWSHEWCAALVQGLRPKDEEGELRRIFAALSWPHVRYTFHPRGKDRFQTLRRTVEMGTADCLPGGTKLLRDDGQMIGIEEVTPGTVIMGDGAWTRVTQHWTKGPKPLIALHLSNGAVLRCTPGHKLFTVPRSTSAGHPSPTRVGQSGHRSWATEIRAGDVRVGDDLLAPMEIPLSADPDPSDPDLAWIQGVYIADGWPSPEKGEINVSGRDADARKRLTGKRLKEDQKRRVQAIAERYGYATRWESKSIAVRSTDWLETLLTCGRGAPNKRVPNIRMGREQTAALLDGLSADAGRAEAGSTVVYSTTSPVLAMQLRLLWRALGRSVSIGRIDHHGGFGLNPIFRVAVRGSADGGRIGKVFPRVRAIESIPAEETFDIETESHRIWLPESDTTVHNCDQATVAICTAAHIMGFKVGARVYSFTGESWDHIAPAVAIPREFPRDAVILETTDGPEGTPESARFGWQVSLRRVQQYRDFWFDLR